MAQPQPRRPRARLVPSGRSDGASQRRERGKQRRCILTREVCDAERLLRFVIAPDDRVALDLAGTLPGRGLWLSATRAAVDRAVAADAFSRASRRRVAVESDLADRIEGGLARRALDRLGLARRAGQLVCGFERVAEGLARGDVAVLVAAHDAAEGGRSKLQARARDVACVDCLSVAELSLALGRENVVHAALSGGALAARFLVEATRLAGFRDKPEHGDDARADAPYNDSTIA